MTGYCPTCGRELSNLMVNGKGGCEAHGFVWAEWDPPVVAYALVAATGESYAIRSTAEAAEAARADADRHLDGALTCGHPAAGAWVNQQYPFTVQALTYEEHEDMLADGTPTLDRDGDEEPSY